MQRTKNNIKDLKRGVAHTRKLMRATYLWFMRSGEWFAEDNLWGDKRRFFSAPDLQAIAQLYLMEQREPTGNDDGHDGVGRFFWDLLQSLVDDRLCEVRSAQRVRARELRRVAVDQASLPIIGRLDAGYEVGLKAVEELLARDKLPTLGMVEEYITPLVQQETIGQEYLPVVRVLLLQYYERRRALPSRRRKGPTGHADTGTSAG
jgi:hypothetical protein